MTDLALAGVFNSALHPRAPKGQSNGGKFAPARNAQAAQAQQNVGAQQSYSKTLGATDAKTQIAGMSSDDLIALSKAAYSFKSSDPKVVALRIAIANEIARRGGNVNDYGGLGKQTPGGPKPLRGPSGPSPATPARKPAVRRPVARTATRRPVIASKLTPAAQGAARNAAKAKQLGMSHGIALAVPMVSSSDGPRVTYNADQRKAMAGDGRAMTDGSFPICNRTDLRRAVKAVGLAPPGKRPAVRAHIRKRAKALGMTPDDAADGV